MDLKEFVENYDLQVGDLVTIKDLKGLGFENAREAGFKIGDTAEIHEIHKEGRTEIAVEIHKDFVWCVTDRLEGKFLADGQFGQDGITFQITTLKKPEREDIAELDWEF